MKKKFAIILALFLIAVVCSAGCIDPETPVDPVDPVVPVDPVDPVTPVDPVVPEEPVDPVVPAEGDFTVTFMMNSAVDSGVYLTVYVDEGEAVAEPAVPEKPKAQYIFVQWTTDKENKHAYDFTTPVTADLVLYADWDVKGTSSGSGHSHSYTATVTTEETCGANGVKTYTCSCGASYTEVILATGSHSYGPWVDGKQTCSVCGYVVTCEHPATALSGTNIVCTVCNENLGAVVAQIGNNYYASFESAMENAVPDEDTIILHAAVQNGVVNKKVVIDTNDNETSLVYDETKGLTVADIKIVKNTVTNKLGTVMFGGEKVVFEVDAEGNYVTSNEDYLVVAYTVTGTTYTVYTENGNGLKMALDAINAVGTGDFTVNLAADITGDVTVVQKPDVTITIDGDNHKFHGAITVDGGSARYETAFLTIKNVDFEVDSSDLPNSDAFIRLGVPDTTSDRYTHGVAVEHCTFTDTNTEDTKEIVAIKSYTGGDLDLTVDGCLVNTGMHSLAQLKNVEENLKVKNCFVYSKNGLNVNNGDNLDMSGCTFDVQGYAVRFGSDIGVYDRVFSIKDSTLKSACAESGDAVIEFRKGAVKWSTLTLTDTTLEGTPTFKGNTADTTIIVEISTADALFAFAKSVNEYKETYSGETVKLTADIDLQNELWTPIGQTGSTQFKGIFDGQGKTISNLNIDSSSQTGGHYSSGIFGWLNAAIVKNVKVNVANVQGNHNVGVIAGYMETAGCTIENCHVTGATVIGKHATNAACGDKVGVIVGHAGNTGVSVNGCTAASSTVTAGRDAGQIVGGATEANVIDCSATDVTVTAGGDCTGANIRNEVIGRVL